MKFLKTVFEFYVCSNLHVAFAVCCFVMCTGKLMNTFVTIEALFLACATFVAYHLIRYVNRSSYGKIHLLDTFSNQYKALIWVLILIAIGLSFFLLFYLSIRQLLSVLLLGIFTLAYAFRFVVIKQKKHSVRTILGLKIVVIAFTWSWAVVCFPTINHPKLGYYFVSIFLFVIAITLPFDIRDVRFDTGQIKTIPIVLGLLKTKIIGIVCLLLSLWVYYVCFNTIGLWQYITVSFLLLLFLLFSSTQQPKYFASFWVEALPIVWYILL